MIKAAMVILIFLVPSLNTGRAHNYAKLIAKESVRWDVPISLISAIIHNETGGTWWTRAKSRTNDYGLMQLHVSKTTNPRYIGREHLLYEPALNIYLGVRFLNRVRTWHRKHCGAFPDHPWWAHYNWGFRVLKNRRYVRNIEKILRRINTYRVIPTV